MLLPYLQRFHRWACQTDSEWPLVAAWFAPIVVALGNLTVVFGALPPTSATSGPAIVSTALIILVGFPLAIRWMARVERERSEVGQHD